MIRIPALVVTLLGALLLWQSHTFATNAATVTYRDPQGYYTGHTDQAKRQAYTEALRLMGGIMFGVGLFRALERESRP